MGSEESYLIFLTLVSDVCHYTEPSFE